VLIVHDRPCDSVPVIDADEEKGIENDHTPSPLKATWINRKKRKPKTESAIERNNSRSQGYKPTIPIASSDTPRIASPPLFVQNNTLLASAGDLCTVTSIS
jgi:hypothetical protein